MQAATTLTKRGHAVTLYEKNGQLGGCIVPGAAHAFKQDMKDYLDLRARVHGEVGLQAGVPPVHHRMENPHGCGVPVYYGRLGGYHGRVHLQGVELGR